MGIAGGWSKRDLARYTLDHPANEGRAVRTCLRLAVWFAFRRYGRKARTIRWVGERRLRWYPDSISVGNAWLFGLLEWDDMHFVRHALQPGDLFIDVGANIGVYSLLATLQTGVDVLAFEPGKKARLRLEEHLELNDVADRVTVSGFVLSDRSGEVSFTVNRDVTNKVVSDAVAAQLVTERLAARRLDELLPDDAFSRSVFLKVDAELRDYEVLLGASKLLKGARPPVIVEWNNPSIAGLLEPIGYRPYGYDPERRLLIEKDWSRTTTSNVIAVVDRAEIEQRLRRAG